MKGLFDLIATMKDEKVVIKLNKTLIDKDGVNFMTAHASKGLEFDTVYMLNSVDNIWQPVVERPTDSAPQARCYRLRCHFHPV